MIHDILVGLVVVEINLFVFHRFDEALRPGVGLNRQLRLKRPQARRAFRVTHRTFVKFGLGGAVRYTHDASGNIVEVVVTQPSGIENRQVVQVGDMNRVESINYVGAGILDIEYDHMGRATSFKMGQGRDLCGIPRAESRRKNFLAR